MAVDGELRDYMLYTPPTLDHSRPIPLVIVFHGSPIDAAGMEDLIHFDGEADKGRFLAAWPNGCSGFWSYAEGGSKVPDEDFVRKMIQQLESRYSIDKARVFLAGVSAGTWMEYRLACDLAEMITAIASIGRHDEAQRRLPAITACFDPRDARHPRRPASVAGRRPTQRLSRRRRNREMDLA